MTFGISFILCFGISAQKYISGTVTDYSSKDPLIGVNIYLDGSLRGTITDAQGKYQLSITEKLPADLIFSLVGFETQTIALAETASNILDVQLSTKAFNTNVITVSASRIEESILESPVTVEKLDLISINQSTSADYYNEISRLKGVSNTQASLTFNSINARGFAGHGNTRFVQLQDGIDNAAPLLNFPTGSIVGISDLDIKSIELIPGTSSALYGPNAFNGILLMTSKDPFNYQGLSAQIKTGVTDGNRVDPTFGATLRYAKAINEKFAFKINASTLWAQDWEANDFTTQRSIETFGNLDQDNPAFDGINLYGDEVRFGIDWNESVFNPSTNQTEIIPRTTIFTRTGLPEDILQESRRAESFKYGGALHYKINKDIETNFSYQWGSGSSVFQGSERYALRDFSQQFIKWELNADNWNIRAYTSLTDAGDSYNLTALGTLPYLPASTQFIDIETNGQTLTLPYTAGWASAASLGMNGALLQLLDIESGSVRESINFADAGGTNTLSDTEREFLVNGLVNQFTNDGTLANLIQQAYPDFTADEIRDAVDATALDWTTAFVNGASGPRITPDENGIYDTELLESIRNTREGLFQQGGAGFIDNSRLYNLEANYDLSNLLNNVVGLQAGGNWRSYSLFTDGTVFNEDFDGDGISERILINEYGAYLQASKKLIHDKLKLSASLRFDKNQNFDGQISPRISSVYSLDDNKKHNLRASFQTGFRNPSTQGQYIFFPTSSILLGGARENAERYGIYEGGAWSESSYFASIAQGNESIRRTIFLDFVKPEQLKSFEFGYKGMSNSKLLLDFNAHYNIYNNFIYQDNVVSKEATIHQGQTIPAGTIFRPYFNAPIDVQSWGSSISLDYNFVQNWKFAGNITYNDFTFDESQLPEGFENFDPAFNTPTVRLNLGLFNRKILDKLSFGINYRWQNEFEWVSSFGNGTIPSYSTVDAQVSYELRQVNSIIKIGANNLFKDNYITNYGGPTIGRLLFLTWTYNQMGN